MAVADIVDPIAYLNARSPIAAAKLAADIAGCIERLTDRNSRGQSHGHPAHAFTEVGMPDMNGTEVAKEMRRHGQVAGARIVA